MIDNSRKFESPCGHGFDGADAPVARLTPGQRAYSSNIYIAGAFSIGSLLQWSESKLGGKVKLIGDSKGDVQGLITTVIQAQMRLQTNDPVDSHSTLNNVPANYAFLIQQSPNIPTSIHPP